MMLHAESYCFQNPTPYQWKQCLCCDCQNDGLLVRILHPQLFLPERPLNGLDKKRRK